MAFPSLDETRFGLLETKDIERAAEIYLHAFPDRVYRWVSDSEHGMPFSRDMIELLWLAHDQTFFTAWHDNHLAGFLILKLPNATILPAMFRRAWLLRALAHMILGHYYPSLSALRAMFKQWFTALSSSSAEAPSDIPHVSAIAVDEDYKGIGIGSGLMNRARSFCCRDFNQLSLFVEPANHRAIRFYRQLGLRIVKTYHDQLLMIWDWTEQGHTGSSGA